MSVSIGTVLPLRLEDLPQDEAAPRMELVDGSLVVTPRAGPAHQSVVGALQLQLTACLPTGWVVLPGANAVRRGSTDRLLIPDVVVAEAHVLTDDNPYIDPSDVLLAVEVESPSTKSTDRLLKRELYAQWRIAHYWIADPVARTLTQLALIQARTYQVGTGAAAWPAQVDPTTLWGPPAPVA